MALTEQTIEVYRGETPTLRMTMDPVIDLTGWTLQMTVARSWDSQDPKLFTVDGVVQSPASGGVVNFPLTDEETDRQAGVYYFDVWRTNAGNLRIVAIGRFVVLGDSRLPEVA